MDARGASTLTGPALVATAGLHLWVPTLAGAGRDGCLGIPSRLRTQHADVPAGALAALDAVILAMLADLAAPDGRMPDAAGPAPPSAAPRARRGARPVPRRASQPDGAA